MKIFSIDPLTQTPCSPYTLSMRTTKDYQRAIHHLKTYCRCCPKMRDGKSDGLCTACRLVFWREATARYQRKKKERA